MEEIKKKIEEIGYDLETLVRAKNKEDDIGTVPLDGLITALELHEPRRGIICRSDDCVFNTVLSCGLKCVHIQKGACNNYKPDLKQDDLMSESWKRL